MAVSRTVGVGMLGSGTVGTAAIRMLHEHADDIERRAGRKIEVRRVGIRNASAARDLPLEPGRFTTDLSSVVDDPEVDIVVEVMGGVEPAREHILRSLEAAKPVVTANKALLSEAGAELFAAAERAGVDLAFEAAVAGGIPLIGPLQRSLAGERLTRVLGIVNGTTNYILTRMSDEGMPFEDALAQAKELGFAEADPSADVDGYDAAAKCAILASIAFDAGVVASDVYREGISAVTSQDLEFAARLGYVVKLLAIAELDGEEVAVRVHPAMVPVNHPLASVRDSFNAVFVEGPNVGELMFYGPGAGGRPTATAVVGDVIEVARRLGDRRGRGTRQPRADRRLRPMEAMETQYYLLLDVADRHGVLAKIAGAFADNRVSIKSVWQEGIGDEALIVIITHRANEGAVQGTVRDLRALEEEVLEVRSLMRVAGEE
jgi:homoserine dehydrogenase